MSDFSIIIPLYNRDNFIYDTLQSITNQTHTEWEVIVIDDGSTDNSTNIVEKISETDARIKLLKRNRLPKGAPTCRNIGIEKATSDYIIFLDSDDLLKPFALRQRADAIEKHPNMSYWVFQTVNFEEKPENEKEVWNTLSDEDNLARFMKIDSVWHTSGSAWRAESVKKHLRFDEKLALWQDIDFHLQALLLDFKYKTFFDYPPDVLYRRHAKGSISQKGYDKNKRASQIYFVKKYFKLTSGKTQLQNDLKKLAHKLAEKNTESRYWFNTWELILWGKRNKIFSLKDIVKFARNFF